MPYDGNENGRYRYRVGPAGDGLIRSAMTRLSQVCSPIRLRDKQGRMTDIQLALQPGEIANQELYRRGPKSCSIS